MAYQPKYASGSASRRGNEKDRTPSPSSRQPAQPKKRGIFATILIVLMTLVIVPASAFLTGHLLMGIVQNVGAPKPAVQSRVADRQIISTFESYVTTQLSSLQASLTGDSPSLPQNEVPGEETPQVTEPSIVREVYTIPADAQVAPEPNQNFFGETTDPSSLQWLLDEAAWMLDGQALYFDLGVQIYEDSKVMYYLDDSIFAITWKEVHEDSVYTFSEIKVRDPSQFRRHLAGGEFGSDMQYMTTEMAQSVNAVVASSGDFYRFRDFGICVYEGQVKRVEGTYAETCMIDDRGDMHFVYGGDITETAAAQAYVDENNIQFSLCFGPILVDNYQVVEHSWYGVGEINEGYARAALCQMGELHYIVATANTQGVHQEIPTVATFCKYISATGCKMAYCLDGGQTAVIVMNDELINRPVYGSQRKISDIIYFATAVPEGG